MQQLELFILRPRFACAVSPCCFHPTVFMSRLLARDMIADLLPH